jgi:hypothetical protein
VSSIRDVVQIGGAAVSGILSYLAMFTDPSLLVANAGYWFTISIGIVTGGRRFSDIYGALEGVPWTALALVAGVVFIGARAAKWQQNRSNQ